MTDILQKIVADKQPEIAALSQGRDFDQYMEEAAASPRTRNFADALVQAVKVTLIAEIKKASPSKGLLRPDFDPETIARDYAKAGAEAVSILTEDKYFQGDRRFLSQVRQVIDRPLLRKDFIVDKFQIPESRLLGADAILLIASILTDDQIREFLKLARTLHLSALCEVHDAEEMRRVIGCGAQLIGINNRDLHTFKVDLQTTFDLVPLAPDESILVSESGIRCWADIELMRDVGVSAVLVGETLMRQDDLRQAIKNLYDPGAPAPLWD